MTSGAAGALPDAGTVETDRSVGARRIVVPLDRLPLGTLPLGTLPLGTLPLGTLDRAHCCATTPSVMTTGSRG